jgi:hypothetical protein
MNKKFLLLVFSLIVFSGCGNNEFKSSWIKTQIVVDGNQEDWMGKLNYFEEEHSAIGFANDKDYLFVCLVTSDTGKIMKAINSGLTIWFDPETDGGNEVGVQFPLPNENQFNNPNYLKLNDENKKDSFSNRVTQILNKKNEFRIVKSDLYPLTQNYLNDSTEVKVKTGFQMYQFVLELRVPISNPLAWNYNLHLELGSKVTVSFETGEIERKQFAGNKQGSGMGGGQRGSGMGKNGQSQNNGNGMKQNSFEKIDFAADVILAEYN